MIKMKKWFALLLTACMVLTSFAGCGQSGQSGSDAPAEKDFVNVAMAYQITTLDSGINTETGNDYIINHMYAGLFRKDEKILKLEKEIEDFNFLDCLLKQEKEQYKNLLEEVRNLLK